MTTPAAEETVEVEASIPWRPGMCATPDCGRLVPEGARLCGPCDILFGSYHDLIHSEEIEEWCPDENPTCASASVEIGPEPEPAPEPEVVVEPEPEAEVAEKPAPTTKKARTRSRSRRKPVPKLEVEVKSDDS